MNLSGTLQYEARYPTSLLPITSWLQTVPLHTSVTMMTNHLCTHAQFVGVWHGFIINKLILYHYFIHIILLTTYIHYNNEYYMHHKMRNLFNYNNYYCIRQYYCIRMTVTISWITSILAEKNLKVLFIFLSDRTRSCETTMGYACCRN